MPDCTSYLMTTDASYSAYKIPDQQQPSLMLAMAGSSRYELLSQFIAISFQETYGAYIGVTYPLLMGLVDAGGSPVAALGIRRALNESPLLLERHLDQPVESCLQIVTGQHVPYHAIAEVGNLTSSNKNDILRLLHSMTCHLEQEGISHILFSGTSLLKRYLYNLGLNPRVLADANPACLGRDAVLWGTYFALRPKVMVGNISRRKRVFPRNTDIHAKAGWQ